MAKVLIIDACSEFRSWARCVLKRNGFDAIEARDALAGLQRGVEDAPDLILVAHDLEGLSGLDVCGRFATDAATRAVPLLLITTDCGDPGEVQQARLVGARGILGRSYRSAELMQPVRKALWKTTERGASDTSDRIPRMPSGLRMLGCV